MQSADIGNVLARLRAAADQVSSSFPTTTWRRISGPGPDTLSNHNGGFAGLALKPGAELVIRCTLDLPADVQGIPLAGQTLEATLTSLYSAELRHNGKVVFAEEGVPVAAGPALFSLISSLRAGDNGELEMKVRVPDQQMTTWLNLRLTTPSIRARFEQIDVAWAQLALADALAATPAEKQVVANAAALVPEKLLPIDGNAVDAPLKRMADALAPLSSKAAAITIHLIGHSHIDMNWLWTWPDTLQVIKRDFRNVLNLMDEYPELTFSHSQAATYEVIRQEEPKLFARLLERIKAGRWEPISMTWVEGDVNMASGEAHVRQLLEGVRYTREVLGCEPTTLHEPDTFGHAGNLPQLAASAGATRYYHHRANKGQENQWPAYWWEGDDGTRLLGISTYSYNGEIHARDLAQAAIRAHKFGHPCSLHFHGIGDHGGGPARQNLDALRRFQKLPLMPKSFCSTLAAYTRQLLEAGPSLPVHRGESSTIFEGCYTTHADTKRYNRHGENLLCTADTLAAMANQNHNAELTEAWRKVLFNQFHDILDGSAIHESYVKNGTDFDQAQATANAVCAAAMDALEAGMPAGRVAVANPLAWERQDWVTVAGCTGESDVWLIGDHGHVTPGQYTPQGLGFVARVPAFGTVSYRIAKDAPGGAAAQKVEAIPAFAPLDNRSSNMLGAAAKDAPYLRVETPMYRIYIRRDCGILVSFFDKRVGRELVGFGLRRGSDYIDTARPDLALNVFQLLDEHPHGMSAWQYHEVHTEHSLLRGATTTLIESGPARCVLQVEHKVRSSTIKQQIIFYHDLPRVDFIADIDWQELGTSEKGVPDLKAAFTAHLPECEAWFETPFAAVRRPADGQEVPALRWTDVGGDTYGIALLNDSKYGHDALGNRLRITLVRSGYEPDAISDIGRHEIRYSLLPHPGNWRDAGVVRQATAFKTNPCLRESCKAKSRPRRTPSSARKSPPTTCRSPA